MAAGLDPDRPEALRTDEGRYVAMKTYFDQHGPAGRRMMCTTAAIHANLDAGRDEVGRKRWRLAHQLGPTLVATFADSPIVGGRASGWMSSRMAAWLAIDPTRTAPVIATRSHNGSHPDDAWAAYALGANVMLIRTADRFVPMLEKLSFARWIDEGHELGYPTTDDLAYHLTTLFPPVRPHGRLELRMMDMVPDPWWPVAVAVTTALIYDEEAAARADAATRPAAGLWAQASRSALAHPLLQASARACFGAALDALERVGCNRRTVDAVAEYAERFVNVGRCPADDRLDAHRGLTRQTAEAI
jgi:glutamate--cysteine ligase